MRWSSRWKDSYSSRPTLKNCLRVSLREFLRLAEREPVPDHSWLSRTRARLPLEVYAAVFTWVLGG